ncbi:MAG: hypothetical protein ACPL4H_08650 [Anaerolineales bacterium]
MFPIQFGSDLFSQCGLLQRALVSDYLLMHGYLICDLPQLPQPLVAKILGEACAYANHIIASIQFPPWIFAYPSEVTFSKN